MTRSSLAAILLLSATSLVAQQPTHDSTQHNRHGQSDSAFAAVQRRGRDVMGVDQYASRHVFEPRPDGGRIELQMQADDSAGIRQILSHLNEVAGEFAQGVFTAPFLVHDQEVPGTRVMAAKRGAIRFAVRRLPRGGEIRISSRDRAAVEAIHEFLAFQRADHRAPAR